MSLFTEDSEFQDEHFNDEFLEVDDREEANPWARFWSRLLDLSIEITGLTLFVAVLLPDLYDTLGSKGTAISSGLGFVLFPVAMIVDALILTIFGTTIGRSIAGIRVEWPSGRPLNFQTALNRNIRLYIVGLALGIPFICLITYFMNHERLTRGLQTPWDEALGTRVYNVRGSTNRTVLVALSFVFIRLVNSFITHELNPPGAVLRTQVIPVEDTIARSNNPVAPPLSVPVPAVPHLLCPHLLWSFPAQLATAPIRSQNG